MGGQQGGGDPVLHATFPSHTEACAGHLFMSLTPWGLPLFVFFQIPSPAPPPAPLLNSSHDLALLCNMSPACSTSPADFPSKSTHTSQTSCTPCQHSGALQTLTLTLRSCFSLPLILPGSWVVALCTAILLPRFYLDHHRCAAPAPLHAPDFPSG